MVHTYPAVSVWCRPSLLSLKALFLKGLITIHTINSKCKMIVNEKTIPIRIYGFVVVQCWVCN